MRRSPLAAVGSLLADDTRAELLTLLLDGRARTGGELARRAGVAPSTASEHLSKLVDGGMVAMEAQGRHRYFRLAGPEVATVLEVLGADPHTRKPASPRVPAALSFARTCYDHLAGELAVRVYEGLLAAGHLTEIDQHPQVESSGWELFGRMGVDTDGLRAGRRPLARRCLDWTERRHHLGGAAGAGLLQAFLDQRWVVSGVQPRAVTLTRTGESAIAHHFGIPARP